MKKKCKEGHYYCYKDSKCKPIPKGFRKGVGGYLRREREDEKEDSKKNGNGNGNGNNGSNGSNGNGSGNGNGGSGGGSNGNGSGGVGESFETIQNSEGETAAVIVDIIGPAHMRPRLNGNGVWKGTHITEAGRIAFGGYKDGIIINPSGSRNKYGLPDNLKPSSGSTKETPLTPTHNRLLVSKKKPISASHELEGDMTEALNPSQFLGALKKAKIASRQSKMNQAQLDANKISDNPNLTKSDTQVTQVGDQAPMDPMTAMAPRKISKKVKKLNQKDVSDYIPQLQLPDQNQPIPKKFQEDMSKLPGLGGGGGGTDAITGKAKTKSLGKRIKDVGKILTRPLHKVKKDPTEKFATEGVASLAFGGSKLIPALVTGIGALGTLNQIKNNQDPAKPRVRYKRTKGTTKKRQISDMERKLTDRLNKQNLSGNRTGGETFDTKDLQKGSNILTPKKGEIMQDEYIPERKMTEKEKRKDDRLKKKYDKSDMKKSMQKQYGKEEGKKVYFATIRKQAMKEEMSDAEFKKLHKDMHDTAKAGLSASQETQNAYVKEFNRRRKNTPNSTFFIQTNKAIQSMKKD